MNELEELRNIITSKGKLTRAKRRAMERCICRAPEWFIGSNENILDMCNYVVYANRKALLIRFL